MPPIEHQASGSLHASCSTLWIDVTQVQLPQDFLDRARGFAASADATATLVTRGNTSTALRAHALLAPLAFSLGQSIELAFKAYLLHKHYPFDDLKIKLRHSIPKAIIEAENRGFRTLHGYDKYVCDLLDKAYRFENGNAKKLQYPAHDGSMVIPSLRALRDLAGAIIGDVAISLWGRGTYDGALMAVDIYDGLRIPADAAYSGPSLVEQRATWRPSTMPA